MSLSSVLAHILSFRRFFLKIFFSPCFFQRGNGRVAEAFHASVEVKGPEEVTVERLLERVLPFFVVDHQEYSVQWPLGTAW